jgi:aminocarboxymuconate-semialdehyde decarboxylase
MSTERDRGVVFVGCEQQATPASQGRRRDVVVSGRRVRTVDVHAHCAVPEAMAMMDEEIEPALRMAQPTDRLRAMDEQGIDVEALSINPFWYTADRDVARELIAVQNEKLAEVCAARPDRFVVFATVALQHPDLAVEQLVEGIKRYGLRGVSTGGSVEEVELADPRFHPFWAKVEDLDVLVFIHPQGTAELETSGRLDGNGVLTKTIGNRWRPPSPSRT